jgi:hypothetical protein
MATVASRLQQLTGLSGVTMAQYLQALAAGSTVAAVLTAYSGLTGATMAQHLLVDRAAAQPTSGGSWVAGRPRRKTENDEALLMLGLL